jgi:hypothetical protein
MNDHLSDSLVSPKGDFGGAGAPGNEIEVTPEMIEALNDAYYEWSGDNGYLLDVGLPGDLLDLRSRLNAAYANASISALDTPKAL